ncbi:hypothetical protein MY9_1904 [Bacillus sp. JS]|nr:hypothetical protein MY9_1904 [Bacillus sp. JS]
MMKTARGDNMALLRFISLYGIAIIILMVIANFAPFLAMPLYYVAMATLVFLIVYLIYHYSQKFRGRKK